MIISRRASRHSAGSGTDLGWLATLSQRMASLQQSEAETLALDSLSERLGVPYACVLEAGESGYRPARSSRVSGVGPLATIPQGETAFAAIPPGQVARLSPTATVMRRLGLASGVMAGVDASSALAVLSRDERVFGDDEMDLVQATAAVLAVRRSSAPPASATTAAELDERIKELSCLYKIGQAFAELGPFAPDHVWEDTLWTVVRLIPEGWRVPPNVGVRLTLNDRAYSSNFFPAGEVLSARVTGGGVEIGTLEVCYVEPVIDGELFLREEEDLIREIAGRIGVATERRRVSAALAESEMRFRQFAENSRDVFWIRSAEDGRLQYVSPAFGNLWPDSPDKDPAIRWLAGIHPDDRQAYSRALDGLFATGEMDIEYRIVEKDGTERWMRDKASAVRDERGAAVWVGGMASETTDLRRTGDAIENERLLTLLRTSPVGMLIADATGRILLINQEAERILDRKGVAGARLDEHGLAPEMLYPDGSLIPDENRPLNRALHTGETVRAEEVLYPHHNRVLTTLTNTTPFYHPDGRIAGAIAVIQDVSHFEELDRLRGEFLGMISHELRTPLTIIKGSAALGFGAVSDPGSELRHYFDLISRQSDHLKALVDNLLDMTWIEAGRLAVNPRSTDLGSLLSGSISAMRQSHPGRVFELQVDERLPRVMADEGRVLQVIQNLLVNACKFSPSHTPVHVRAGRAHDQVQVSVTDEGEGIDAADLARIFDKFQRTSRDASTEGIGLGLAISKSLVEAHGGRIWAESAGPGRGSAFHFTLPISAEGQSAVHARADVSHLTIIALDDEPQILKYLQRSLSDTGYSVRPAFDTEEALRLVREGAGDLMLLDLFLGGDSGFDVLHQVREFSDIPVIILTGSHDDEDAVRALHLGADDYVRKPFSSAELDARIQAVLRRRAARPLVQRPLEIGEVQVDLAAREATRAGVRVQLSATEYRLLVELMLNAGRVLTHKQLLEAVWGPEYSTEVSLIRPYIKSLRKKIGDDAREPSYIFTERQVGYWFRK